MLKSVSGLCFLDRNFDTGRACGCWHGCRVTSLEEGDDNHRCSCGDDGFCHEAVITLSVADLV